MIPSHQEELHASEVVTKVTLNDDLVQAATKIYQIYTPIKIALRFLMLGEMDFSDHDITTSLLFIFQFLGPSPLYIYILVEGFSGFSKDSYFTFVSCSHFCALTF